MDVNDRDILNEEEVERVLKIFAEHYPDAKSGLNYSSPFELLIATMLSAQSTDNMVNQITEKLFIKYNTPSQFLQLESWQLENEIKQIGLYKNKSKNILKTCRILIDFHNGQVPNKRELLEQLPGVGRKTANVVLSNIFNIPTIPVDTHVFRVVNRIGLVSSNKVLETEYQLMKIIPEILWIDFHHWVIWHGRKVCNAKKPKCNSCELLMYCKYGKKNII
ncbi:MAG: endonuclease III [Vulcanibacillus sp.]